MTPLNATLPATPKKPLVLIVDDQHKNLQLAASVLSPFYRLLLTDNGQKALTIAVEKQPDLVLLDVMMPGLSGYEVCAQLKAQATTEDIPVIFLTAKTEEDDILAAFEAGGVDYVTKPFKAKEVLARIKTQIALRHSEKQLQQHNAFKDRLLAIIGHDLRGPVGGILKMMELIRENQQAFDKAELIRYCAMMEKSTANVLDLLMTLLEWSQNQQPQAIETQNLEVAAQVQQVLGQVSQLAAAKGIRLHHQVPAGLQVRAEANRLQTILRNLLSNGIKFTRPGARVTVSATAQPGLVAIAVADEGVGIKPEIAQGLLNKTNSFTSYGTHQEKGTGLGLNLCVGFLEQLGGQLCIDSEPGKGSTFCFTLPAAT